MSPKANTTQVVICWHMHQPYYKEQISGKYQLPWTYLHAIKDYIDMAAIIEELPQARAVVNFCPTLLEQIEDYRRQVCLYFNAHQPLTDPLLAQLVSFTMPATLDEKKQLIQCCLRANEKRLINSYPAYAGLAAMGKQALKSETQLDYLNEQYYFDLITWYHLAWLGETVKRQNPIAHLLINQGKDFSLQNRLQLLELIGEIFSNIIPKYRSLAESNQIELSVTPYSHPIIPLMLDIESAHEAMPGATLPKQQYPGGLQRAEWQLNYAKEVFQRFFGFEPKGCWPSEGAVSKDTIRLIEKCGYSWTATGGNVLFNSLDAGEQRQNGDCIHRPYKLKDSELYCYFRDDNLSDLIGFTYADWNADDAVNNFIHHLSNISSACKDHKNRVISVIVDGENCWEYYSHNGYHFLNTLYSEIAKHSELHLTTFSDTIANNTEAKELKTLVAGSWVHGTFSTWIGEPSKNQAWNLLIEAKLCYDKVIENGSLPEHIKERANIQLAICEGSDWSWWFGDYNAEESVVLFDTLYRTHLKTLYQILGQAVPQNLNERISYGSDNPATSGAMRRANED